MKLIEYFLIKNDCYNTNRTITPTGIVVHSTGTNNKTLKRYIQPDDGKLGKNTYNNHWNMPGVSKCVHAFIGMLSDGSIATYQTLPWTKRPWGCGKGTKGTYNDSHIQFEICEDGLTDATYFNKVYTESVELCVYLCKKYSIKVDNIVCHSEARDLGYASNHADVMHWFPKHGKSMDTFRKDVQLGLDQSYESTKVKNPYQVPTRTIYYKAIGMMTGNDVKYVQFVVGATCDGKCGPATGKAIKEWQKKHKLEADGKFGPACRKVAATLYN